jgi:hypothetical protein
MLPSITTSAIAGVTALSLAAASAAPAQALGKDERNFLKGVAATLIVGAIINDATKSRKRYTPVTPVYQDPNYVPIPDGGSIYRSSAARAFQAYTSEERRLIQRRLAAWGYYRSGIDGAYGPGTHAAVMAYARDRGETRRLGSVEGAFGLFDSMIY